MAAPLGLLLGHPGGSPAVRVWVRSVLCGRSCPPSQGHGAPGRALPSTRKAAAGLEPQLCRGGLAGERGWRERAPPPARAAPVVPQVRRARLL